MSDTGTSTVTCVSTTSRIRWSWLDLVVVAVAGMALFWSFYKIQPGGDVRIEIREPFMPFSAKKGKSVRMRGAISSIGNGTIRILGVAPC